MGSVLKLSWEDVEKAVDHLAYKILESDFYDPNKDEVCLVPVVRGGLTIATMLSHRLNGLPVRPVTYQTRERKDRDIGRLLKYWRQWNKLIIVDDIIDTGETISELNIHLKDIQDGEKDQFVSLATLCKNNDLTWSVFQHQWNALDVSKDNWVVFPWELPSILQDLR